MKVEGHECGETVVVTVDPSEGYRPRVFSLSEWADYEDKLLQYPSTDRAARAVQRLVIGLATDCIIDKNNCIDLPDEFDELLGQWREQETPP